MSDQASSLFIRWLQREVAPALGCTEPVAISFTTAYAAKHLATPCEKISGFISANLYKNATGVTIPGTTVNGVALAAAIGAFGGDADKGLQTLAGITSQHVEQAQALVDAGHVTIDVQDTPDFIHLDLTLSAGDQTCRVVVKGTHTNVVELYINGEQQPLHAGENSASPDAPHPPQRRLNCQLSLSRKRMTLLSPRRLRILRLFWKPPASIAHWLQKANRKSMG